MRKLIARRIELKRFKIAHQMYFITAVTENRVPIFKSQRNIEILLSAFNLYREKYKYKIVAFVILPDHFHWLIVTDVSANISTIMKSVKGYTAVKLGAGKLWQHQFLDHCVRQREDYTKHIEYIHKNPVKHGLARDVKEYIWSSFNNYEGSPAAVLKIDKLI